LIDPESPPRTASRQGPERRFAILAPEKDGLMNASTWSWRLVCAAGMVLALCLARPSWADDKVKKGSAGGKDDGRVIILQLDASKASPALIKQLMELSRSGGTDEKKAVKKDDDDDDDKKKGAKKDDDKKKGAKKDDDDDDKKADGKKSNIVQVDLNKLSPDLAKRLAAELARSKGKDAPQKGGKKDDNDDDKKKNTKKDDDDNKKGNNKNNDDDDKKGKKKDDDDDKKKGKKKDD
jgi:hypothetical protein